MRREELFLSSNGQGGIRLPSGGSCQANKGPYRIITFASHLVSDFLINFSYTLLAREENSHRTGQDMLVTEDIAGECTPAVDHPD